MREILLNDPTLDSEKISIQKCLEAIMPSFSELSELLKPMLKNEPARFKAIYQSLFTLIQSISATTMAAAFSRPIQKYHRAPNVRGGARGGARSGEVRRANREKRWESSALEIAKKYRRLNPGASQDEVATEIAAAWKAKTKIPGYITLKRFVSRMEHAEHLAKRQT
jgi:hypothetical protein